MRSWGPWEVSSVGEEAFQTEGPRGLEVGLSEGGGAWGSLESAGWGGVGAGLLCRTHIRVERASPQEGAWLSS